VSNDTLSHSIGREIRCIFHREILSQKRAVYSSHRFPQDKTRIIAILHPFPLVNVLNTSQPIANYLANPLALVAIFVMSSLLMIWRLQAMENKGFEGTVLGTLIMPYCSGFANLIFAYVMSRSGGNGRAVIENCIVNNVTNLTLILGLAAILCSPAAASRTTSGRATKRQSDDFRLNRLDLLFTLIAVFLFTGTLWALAKNGVLDFYDGLVLVGLFLFWQVLHVFEILKNNVRKNRTFHWSIAIDVLLIVASAYGIYLSVDHLVTWVSNSENRFLGTANLGWLSGALMVLPNAFLALYYARIGRQDIVVSSQVGDGHICIPMCVGLYALFDPIVVPEFFETSIIILLGAGAVHFLSIALLGRLPRAMGWFLLGGYAFFLFKGIVP
jgi:cation:H+ antiporter